jgi:hypothetical protein
MKNKKFVSFIIIVASIILLFLAFKSIDESTKGTLIEFIEQSSEPDKPFVMESLIYGSSMKTSQIEDDSVTSYIQLTEQEIRKLLEILSTTTFERIDPLKHKIKISFWVENTNDLYSVDITNRGYTMSYDVKVDFRMTPFNDKLLLWAPTVGHFLTDDFSIIDKLEELHKVPRENE